MKKFVLLLVTNLLTSGLFWTHDAYANSDLGRRDPNCFVGTEPLVFRAIRGPTESIGIFRAKATIDFETYLLYTYNIYYSIGGEVSLVSGERRTRLLRWDGFEQNVLSGIVEHKGLTVECQL
jgi:hypothetical protein